MYLHILGRFFGSGFSADPDPDSGKKFNPDPEKNLDPKHNSSDIYKEETRGWDTVDGELRKTVRQTFQLTSIHVPVSVSYNIKTSDSNFHLCTVYNKSNQSHR